MEVVYGIENYKSDKPSCVTVGTFDGLHIGHKKIISQLTLRSRELGLRSVVITFDPHPRQILKPDVPVNFVLGKREKLQAFAETGIDCLIIHPFSLQFASIPAKAFLNDILCKQLRMRHLVKGFNNHFGSDRLSSLSVIEQIGRDSGFTVSQVEAASSNGESASSTLLRKLVAEGDMDGARQILGRCFPITGTVSHGRMIGRGIGFPTANIDVGDPCKIIPAIGAYAAFADVDGSCYPTMLNIGSNPTVNADSSQIRLEAHLIGYKGNLYDKTISINIVRKIRGEQKFASLEMLKAQLLRDKETIKAICRQEFPQNFCGS